MVCWAWRWPGACSVWFSIKNNCAASLDASEFTWDRCFPTADPCTSIEPDVEGIMEPALTSTGHRDFSFVVKDGDGPHTITFSSDVESFNDTSLLGCTTSAPRAPRQSSSPSAPFLLALLLRRCLPGAKRSPKPRQTPKWLWTLGFSGRR